MTNGAAMLRRTDNLAVVGHIGPPAPGHAMSAPHALSALAALGQSTRLDVLRLLMRQEPIGMQAGAIADVLACAHNTLSSHLSILARAGLIQGSRKGRAIVYRAHLEGMRALIRFLVTDCCGGHPQLCGFIDTAAEADCCSAPKANARKRRR